MFVRFLLSDNVDLNGVISSHSFSSTTLCSLAYNFFDAYLIGNHHPFLPATIFNFKLFEIPNQIQ